MFVVAFNQRSRILLRYLAFNAVLLLGTVVVVQALIRLSAQLSPIVEAAVDAEPSRVEKFKQAEIEAALAPQLPVPRLLVAQSPPEVPPQVLAVRLDQAESIKSQPLRLKKKPTRQAKFRSKKPVALAGLAPSAAKIPPAVVAIADGEIGYRPRANKKAGYRVTENPRDITNRSLGVLVAMKN